MENINLERISKLLSEKIGENIVINRIELIGSGYHSDGFKLTSSDDRSFFIKRVKSNDLGFEFPERKVSSLLVSDGMGKRSGQGVKPIGVILENENQGFVMPEINDNTKIYHIQEHIEDHKSGNKNYFELLIERKDKKYISDSDVKELEVITDLISKIHFDKHLPHDQERLKKIYNDSLRSIISNPELTLLILQTFPDDHPLLPRKKHKDHLGLMLEAVYRWEGRHDRLRNLHGDFWGSNLFFNERGVHLVDFSRIPFGDPGIDICWWVFQYLWFYYETDNKYYKDLGEKFLELYEKKSGDKEIREAIIIAAGIVGILYITPLFHPNLDMKIGERFLNNVWKILENKKFDWN